MAIFNKYEKCYGMTLYSIGRYRAELWFVAPNYEIIPHSHPEENIELMFLFGRTTFKRLVKMFYKERYEYVKTRWKFFGKCFSVPAGTTHWFATTSWPLVFINFQTFLPGHKPKSAAQDFKINNI
jgi:quercetin dioxygenase-like cupin family protein